MADLLRTVTSSDKRKNLLVMLDSGPRSWDQIRDALQVTSTGMLPQIKILRDRGLVRKDKDQYYLTDIGQSVAQSLVPLVKVTNVFDTLEGYLSDHDFSVLPASFRQCIGDIAGIRVTEVETAEVFEPHQTFIDNLANAQWVFGIVPVLYPSHSTFFVDLAGVGFEVTIVMTHAIFNRVRDEYRDELYKGLNLPNLHFLVSDEDIRFACVATDRYLWLSLFTKGGIYDPKKELISYEPNARQWGERLVRYYQIKSWEVTRDHIL
jgi:predicted transcriptional regulator